MQKLFNTLSRNEDGVVFITVLMIIIMMMTLTATVINLNVSSVQGSETEYRRLQAVELTKGLIYYHVAKEQNPPPPPWPSPYNFTHTIDLNLFSHNITRTNNGSGIDGTNVLTIITTY